jgi:hypothetical protein
MVVRIYDRWMKRFGRRYGLAGAARPLQWVAFVFAGAGIGLVASAWRLNTARPVFLGLAAAALLLAFLAWRPSRYGVFVDDRDILLVRPWGRRRIPWTQVAEIIISTNRVSLSSPVESWTIMLRLNGGQFETTSLTALTDDPATSLRIKEAVADLQLRRVGVTPSH